jgi:methanogenic corrinoid protein MtbC1
MTYSESQGFYPSAVPDMRSASMNAYCKTSLLEVIESQIIPRLIDSHPCDNPHVGTLPMAAFTPEAQELATFSQLCILENATPVNQYIDRLVQQQVANGDIFLNLIAPAARQLGELWEQDLVDFTQVTLGLVRLQQITHRLGYEYQGGPQLAGPVRRMMIASAPGSQHILGLVMVSELFRKAGWHVVVEISATEEGLLQAARNEWFDLIGLSVGLIEQLPRLPALIAKLKAASRKPRVPVMLGGVAFSSSPVSAQSVGADAISSHALEAVELGAALLSGA